MAGVGCAMCCDIFCSPSLLMQGFKGHRGEPGAPGPKVSVNTCICTDQFALNKHNCLVSETQTAITHSFCSDFLLVKGSWTYCNPMNSKLTLWKLQHFVPETVQFRPCKYEPNCLRESDQKTKLLQFSDKCQVTVMGDSCFLTESLWYCMLEQPN